MCETAIHGVKKLTPIGWVKYRPDNNTTMEPGLAKMVAASAATLPAENEQVHFFAS